MAEKSGDVPFAAVDGEGEVTGFFVYAFDGETREGLLKFVIVDPEKRGQGLGREMMLLAVRYAIEVGGARAVRLNVFSVNEPAKRCYERAGFVERRTDADAFAFREERWGRCNMVITREQ